MKEIFLSLAIIISIIPIAFISGVSFNPIPLQMLLGMFVLFYFNRINITLVSKSILLGLIFLVTSRFNLKETISSPLAATLLAFILSSIFDSKHFKLKYYFYYYLFIFYIIFTIPYLFLFYTTEMGSRFKGFGSGTIQAISSLTFLFLFWKLYWNNSLNKIFLIPCGIFFIVIIGLTQSRGTFISLLFILFYEFFEIKSRNKYVVFAIIITALSTLFIYYFESFIDRFYVKNYDNLELFTSGRSTTQNIILSDLVNSDYFDLFFGNGLNSLQNLVELYALEYPHFDLLFLLYEGGLILTLFYLVVLIIFYKSFRYKLFFYIYLISSFHTNMILSPAFILILKALDSIAYESQPFNKFYVKYYSSISN